MASRVTAFFSFSQILDGFLYHLVMIRPECIVNSMYWDNITVNPTFGHDIHLIREYCFVNTFVVACLGQTVHNV